MPKKKPPKVQSEQKEKANIIFLKKRTEDTNDSRLERRLDLFAHEFLPVDMPREEGVVLDVLGPVATESMGRVPIEESDEERAGLRVDFLGESERLLEDLAVHLVRVFVIERG